MKLPICYSRERGLEGATSIEIEPFYSGPDVVRKATKAGLWKFVDQNRALLTGRVLDFGCGRPGTCYQSQPYRSLVSGTYKGYDVGDPQPSGTFDTVLCTEVLMYVADPEEILSNWHSVLKPGGDVVLTVTSAWPEIEEDSLWRFTRVGTKKLLEDMRYEVVSQQEIFRIGIGNFGLTVCHGTIARSQT